MPPPFFGGGGTGGGGSGTPSRLSYRHRQDTASSVWVIAHGLGFRPAGVQVTDAEGNDVEGVVSHPDLNTTQIHFDVPIAGIADCS
jgi:hypothetical protein